MPGLLSAAEASSIRDALELFLTPSGDCAPSDPGSHCMHGTDADPVFCREIDQVDAACASLPDGRDGVGSEFGVSVLLAMCAVTAPLDMTVGVVFASAAEKKVGRVAAGGIVTAMADIHAIGNRAEGQHPRSTMGELLYVPPEGSIAASPEGLLPKPTVGGLAACDFTPEPFLDCLAWLRDAALVTRSAAELSAPTPDLGLECREVSTALTARAFNGSGTVVAHQNPPDVSPRTLARRGGTLLPSIVPAAQDGRPLSCQG